MKSAFKIYRAVTFVLDFIKCSGYNPTLVSTTASDYATAWKAVGDQLTMAAKRTAKNVLQESFSSGKHHRRDASEAGNDLSGFQAPRSGLRRKRRGKLRRCTEREGTVSGLGKSCVPTSSKQTTSIMIDDEKTGCRVGSGTRTTVPWLMAENGGRSEISTTKRKTQSRPEGMRVVRKSEESLQCNRIVSTKTRRLGIGLHAVEGEEKVKSEKLATVLEDNREEGSFSILQRMELLQKSNSAKSELNKIKEDQYSLMVSLNLLQKKLERVV